MGRLSNKKANKSMPVNVELVSSVAVILLTVVSVYFLSHIYLAHSIPSSRPAPHTEL